MKGRRTHRSLIVFVVVVVVIFALQATMPPSSSSSKSSKAVVDAAATSSGASHVGRRLRLVVFDLDYTIWQPEMYQLYGKPRLVPTDATSSRQQRGRKIKSSSSELDQTRTMQDGMMITDGSGSIMRVFPGA